MQSLTQVKDKAVETIKPVLTSALERTTPVLTSAIEGAIEYVERIDPEAKQREHVFASEPAQANGGQVEESKVAGDNNAAEGQESLDSGAGQTAALRQLKVVSEDLIDLWLFEGSKGLRYVQASKAYQLTDPYVHYVEKFEAVKSKSQQIVAKLEEKKKQVTLFYDEASKFVGMLIRVVSERQDELVAYVRSTYENVQVFVQDNYLRLDFNKDGDVSMEDLRASLLQFYEFLKSYDYLETTTRISSTLYDQAVSMMKKDQQQSRSDQQDEQAQDGEVKPEGANSEQDQIELQDLAAHETEQKVSQDDLSNQAEAAQSQ